MNGFVRRDHRRDRRRWRDAGAAARPLGQAHPPARAGRLAAAEPENWLPQNVFVENRYVSEDTWYDAHGKPFQPQIHYFVGGATKLYGAALYRLRKEDFGELAAPRRRLARVAHLLRRAGALLHTGRATLRGARHARRGSHRPTRKRPVPVSPVSHEPRIQQLADDLEAAGYHPFHAPCGVRLDETNLPYSHCVRCTNCDGFPCAVHGKSDAEVLGVRPALEHENVTLLTNAKAVKLETNPSGSSVTEVLGRARGRDEVLRRRRLRGRMRSCEHGKAPPDLR